MHDPVTLAARTHLRDLDRAAARGPRLVPLGTAGRLRRHVHAYSVAAVAIAMACVVVLGVLGEIGRGA